MLQSPTKRCGRLMRPDVQATTPRPAVYAGVGPRKAPAEALALLSGLSASLARAGLMLRTGYADGADLALYQGAIDAGGAAELILPWSGYNQCSGGHVLTNPRAMEIARQMWGPEPVTDTIARLLATGVTHVLGLNLDDPAPFVVYWLPFRPGQAVNAPLPQSGTAVGVRTARAYGIPAFNVADPEQVRELRQLLADMGTPIDWGAQEPPSQPSLF